MVYSVKGEILGFKDLTNVDVEEIDELFLTMKDTKNPNLSFTLINPYLLREYSFELPIATKTLLEIEENSRVKVYNIVVLQKPIEESFVNFLAPIVFNEDNKTLAQVVLEPNKYPNFGLAEPIKNFIKN